MEDYSDFDELYQAILLSMGIQPESVNNEDDEKLWNYSQCPQQTNEPDNPNIT